MSPDEEPQVDEQEQSQEVAGVPIAIRIAVGPGVLVPGAPVGEGQALFLHDGCVHSALLAVFAYAAPALTEAYRTASEQAAEQEGNDAAPDTSGFVA